MSAHIRRRGLHSATVAISAAALLAGCGASAETGDYWILDDGEGAQLCDMLLESYPPQCKGIPVISWDWNTVEHEEAQGVRWGLYTVAVQADGDRVHVTVVDEP